MARPSRLRRALPWIGALLAAYMTLGVGMATAESCFHLIRAHEGGVVDSSWWLFGESCTETFHGRVVGEASVLYWYPLVAAISVTAGTWLAIALVARVTAPLRGGR
jgi:hypothetical protein